MGRIIKLLIVLVLSIFRTIQINCVSVSIYAFFNPAYRRIKVMDLIRITLLFLSILAACPVYAATYFIDYNSGNLIFGN